MRGEGRVRVLELGAKAAVVLRVRPGRVTVGVRQGCSFPVPGNSMEQALREQGWGAKWGGAGRGCGGCWGEGWHVPGALGETGVGEPLADDWLCDPCVPHVFAPCSVPKLIQTCVWTGRALRRITK